MTTLSATNTFNVIASINQHWQTQLAAITKPVWLPNYFVVFDFPESNLQTPCFSFHHTPLLINSSWSGRITGDNEVGGETHHSLEINIWTSRGNPSWSAQKRTMMAMIQRVYIASTSIIIQDYTNPDSPSATTNKVNITGLEGLGVAPDTNPDIERARFVSFYHWTQRVS